MNSKEKIVSLGVIILGIIMIFNVFGDSLKLSQHTINDFDYFRGVVVQIKHNEVWLAKDSTVDIHKLNNDYIHFKVKDSEVLSKLKSVMQDWNHIVEAWFITSSKSSRSHYNSHTTYLIEQIVLDGEVLLKYENHVFWKLLLFPILPLLVIVIYFISCFKDNNGNDKHIIRL